MIKRGILQMTKPENLIRLAKWLRLDIDGMSYNQIAGLVHWRITRSDKYRYIHQR